MTAPKIKGWCPGAYRPMMSGDGLVMRVRPWFGRLSRAQVHGLCDLAERYGTGRLQLTNRGNLQLRGVAERDHDAVIACLAALALLADDPVLEERRNLVLPPFWEQGGRTYRLAGMIYDALAEMPDLPSKLGFAVDVGPARLLADVSADFRIECGPTGLILRADGALLGRPITEANARDALLEMVTWFADQPGARRMRSVVEALPDAWQSAAPGPVGARITPGVVDHHRVLGAPFGQIAASDLRALDQGVTLTPWRLLVLEGAHMREVHGFVTEADDPLLRVDACQGAPYCGQAQTETLDIARRLAGHVPGQLHVSGCAKGCATRASADTVLVGRAGRFDLVAQGQAWDAPARSGLSREQVLDMFGVSSDAVSI